MMTSMQKDNTAVATAPGAAFEENYVEADGFRIRYLEAGQGTPLVHLHGAGGLMLTPAHDLLSQANRVTQRSTTRKPWMNSLPR
jgi:hypothetical protein